MLDLPSGLALVRPVLHTRHDELVREQRRHRLAVEARTARAGRTSPHGPRRRRVLARLIPATR